MPESYPQRPTAVQGTHPREHNRSLGERCHDAMLHAARCASEAERFDRLAKRVFSQLVIAGTGPVSQREHAARCHLKYTEAEDMLISARTAANLAKASADGLEMEFKEWQSRNSTARAEMQLR